MALINSVGKSRPLAQDLSSENFYHNMEQQKKTHSEYYVAHKINFNNYPPKTSEKPGLFRLIGDFFKGIFGKKSVEQGVAETTVSSALNAASDSEDVVVLSTAQENDQVILLTGSKDSNFVNISVTDDSPATGPETPTECFVNAPVTSVSPASGAETPTGDFVNTPVTQLIPASKSDPNKTYSSSPALPVVAGANSQPMVAFTETSPSNFTETIIANNSPRDFVSISVNDAIQSKQNSKAQAIIQNDQNKSAQPFVNAVVTDILPKTPEESFIDQAFNADEEPNYTQLYVSASYGRRS